MSGRDVGILRVRDQARYRRPRSRASSSAPGICVLNSGREFSMDRGHVHADLLEHAPMHDCHRAAAAIGARMVGARPGLPEKPPGRQGGPDPVFNSSSMRSNSAQISLRNAENQTRAFDFSRSNGPDLKWMLGWYARSVGFRHGHSAAGLGETGKSALFVEGLLLAPSQATRQHSRNEGRAAWEFGAEVS